MKERMETPYMTMWKEDDILYLAFADKLDIDIEIAKQCVKDRIDFSEGVSYPCLIDITGMKSVTKEAREYFAKEDSKKILARAGLAKSALSRMLGNIFLVINKPGVPTKLFTNEKEAKEWLKKYIPKNK